MTVSFAPAHRSSLFRWIILPFLFLTLAAAAQTPQVRITQPVTDSQTVTLRGQVHPLAKAKYDQGPVNDLSPSTAFCCNSRARSSRKRL